MPAKPRVCGCGGAAAVAWAGPVCAVRDAGGEGVQEGEAVRGRRGPQTTRKACGPAEGALGAAPRGHPAVRAPGRSSGCDRRGADDPRPPGTGAGRKGAKRSPWKLQVRSLCHSVRDPRVLQGKPPEASKGRRIVQDSRWVPGCSVYAPYSRGCYGHEDPTSVRRGLREGALRRRP